MRSREDVEECRKEESNGTNVVIRCIRRRFFSCPRPANLTMELELSLGVQHYTGSSADPQIAQPKSGIDT